MSYLTKKYFKRALKKLISLENYKDFEFVVTLYTYTIIVIRYLTFDVLCETWGMLVTCEIINI